MSIGILPWVFIWSLLAFYFHAWGILGHAPSYAMPDPKNFDIYDFYAPIIYNGMQLWLLSSCGLVLAVVIYLFEKEKWQRILSLFLFCVTGQIIATVLLFSRVFEWFID